MNFIIVRYDKLDHIVLEKKLKMSGGLAVLFTFLQMSRFGIRFCTTSINIEDGGFNRNTLLFQSCLL